jgi:hypothetical protein
MNPTLSIAIVLYNSADGLEDCLRSINEAVDLGWAEVIAVDNASPDTSAEVLRRELPDAKLIRLGKNRGFAGGANAALGLATGRYWLLLNPDVSVPPGGPQMLVGWMDAHRSVAAASPEMRGPNGASESPGRAAPSILRALLELSRLHRFLPRQLRGRILRGPYWPGGDQLGVGWVPGTAMFVRPEAAGEVGLLREDLFMYGEDIEWCWRMRRAGWRIGVCSGTTFVHGAGTSARRSWGDDGREQRIASGVDAACRLMYGATHARALAGVTALSLWVESCAPRRDPEHKQRAKRAARAWQRLAARR